MMRRELLEFRTPQHPSLGTNNWGGASPLLARDIPKAALEQRYLRLNTIRERDQVFPSATIEDEIFRYQPSKTIGDEVFAFLKANVSKRGYAPNPRRGKGRLWRWRPHKKSATLGNPRSKWLPKLDSTNKWPNGWC
ncbi:hypothetical protein C2S51_028269 [Perilla frutescens var. frutescens]|nr:hypothetical protein C2S51_028269 [Perilla frutescens var. frutescens]